MLLKLSAASCYTSDPLFLKSIMDNSYESGCWSCGWFRNAYAVDVDGRIYPCHRGPELPAEEYSIGNVQTQSIDQDKLYRLRQLEASYCVVRQIQRNVPPGSPPDPNYVSIQNARKRVKQRNLEQISLIREFFDNARLC